MPLTVSKHHFSPHPCNIFPCIEQGLGLNVKKNWKLKNFQLNYPRATTLSFYNLLQCCKTVPYCLPYSNYGLIRLDVIISIIVSHLLSTPRTRWGHTVPPRRKDSISLDRPCAQMPKIIIFKFFLIIIKKNIGTSLPNISTWHFNSNYHVIFAACWLLSKTFHHAICTISHRH